jgi:hypothetical protein
MLEMTRQELRLAPTTFWDENKPMKRRQKISSSVNNEKQEKIQKVTTPAPLPQRARKAGRN